MQYAVVQTACLLVGIYKTNRYPAFLLSLLASLPCLWFPATGSNQWEITIWLPAAFLLIPMQAISSFEACFRFGERYVIVSRICGTLAGLAVGTAACFWRWPSGNLIGQVVLAAKYQRVFCCTLLVSAVIVYAMLQWRGLIARQDGAHLILCAALSVTWVVPILRPIPASWEAWIPITWPVTVRTWLVAAWVLLVAFRRSPVGIHARPIARELPSEAPEDQPVLVRPH